MNEIFFVNRNGCNEDVFDYIKNKEIYFSWNKIKVILRDNDEWVIM